MSGTSDFVIENGVLRRYTGPGGDVTVPEGVTAIAKDAFRECRKLTGVVLPEGVGQIGPDAFNSCGGLKRVSLPASLKKIGSGAFRLCGTLTELDIADVGAWCGVTYGNEYAHPLYEAGFGFGRYGGTQHLAGNLFLNGEAAAALIIPEGVKRICKLAFCNCANVTAVSVPGSLKAVGSEAFVGCKKIDAVHITDLRSWLGIRFDHDSNVVSSYFESSDANPLHCGAALTLNGATVTELMIPGDVEEIGAHAFAGCTSLRELTLSEGVRKLGARSFQRCRVLQNVSVPSSLEQIGSDAFYDCRQIKSVRIGDLRAWCGVKISYRSNPLSYGSDLLLNGEPVRDMTVPESLETLSGELFSGCKSLKSVTIPEGVTSIGSNTFNGCKNLQSVTLPESLTSIDPGAFNGCSSLKDLRIPDSVTEIGGNAFQGCRSLTEVSLPPALKKIDYGVFSDCDRLVRIFLPEMNDIPIDTYLDGVPFPGCRAEVTVAHWSVTATKLLADADITAIHTDSISLVPTSLRALAAVGFAKETEKDLGSVRAAEHIAFIKKHAAKLCEKMTENREAISFLCKNKLIPAAALDVYLGEAEKREDVELKATLLAYQNELGRGTVTKAREKKEKAAEDYQEALFRRTIERDLSAGIAGMTFVVSGLGKQWPKVWHSRDEIRSHLETNGAGLGSSVNRKTDYLVDFDPKGDSDLDKKAAELGVPVIGPEEFNAMVCRRFRDAGEIAVPEWLKTIPDFAFCACRSMTGVSFPEGVTSIGESAFRNCESLTGIEIPKSVTSIGAEAFSGCKALRTVTIPGSVKAIKKMTFEYCSGLKTVTLGKGVASIGYDAFSKCARLTDVTIPASVKAIDDWAFGWSFDRPDLVIHAPAGSFAETYAKRNQIRFEALED